MKIIKSKKRKAKALVIINIRKEYRELYNQRLKEKVEKHNQEMENVNLQHEQEKEELSHFFEKNLRKQKDSTEKKYKTLLAEKDEKIAELEDKFEKNKRIFKYIKEREQDLENIMNIVGTKLKGFAELVTNGYSTIQNSFSQVEGYQGYNDKHLKNDQKVIEATKDI